VEDSAAENNSSASERLTGTVWTQRIENGKGRLGDEILPFIALMHETYGEMLL